MNLTFKLQKSKYFHNKNGNYCHFTVFSNGTAKCSELSLAKAKKEKFLKTSGCVIVFCGLFTRSETIFYIKTGHLINKTNSSLEPIFI